MIWKVKKKPISSVLYILTIYGQKLHKTAIVSRRGEWDDVPCSGKDGNGHGSICEAGWFQDEHAFSHMGKKKLLAISLQDITIQNISLVIFS